VPAHRTLRYGAEEIAAGGFREQPTGFGYPKVTIGCFVALERSSLGSRRRYAFCRCHSFRCYYHYYRSFRRHCHPSCCLYLCCPRGS